MGSGSIDLSRKRRGVALGMAVGLAMTIAVLAGPGPRPAVPDRAALWAACSIGPACWLVLAVGLLARHRFFSAPDIDAAGLTEASSGAKRLQALTQNTLEQTALAVVAYALWLIAAPTPGPLTVVLCAAIFSCGRLLFFLTYSRGLPRDPLASR
jgi:uncharacterized MAPEG superfamily protein